MAEPTATRRLAAIVVADVVGYSRLLGADEAATISALMERRKAILEPVVRDHSGRIVNVVGDGVLLEFASAVRAVEAAIALQLRFAAANEGLPGDRHIVLRIGINLGEVVGEGSDIYGDGVNIAARLEPICEPGGLCISAKVYDEVRGKVEAVFADMGERSLKNIAGPVRVYRSTGGGATAELQQASSSSPTIAVLPFANMSDDKHQQYLSDGITEDIVTELSRFRQLQVLARNSSFRFRGLDLDMIRVGRELGVNYLVEGSVRRLGVRIRITAQLIDARTGHHLWAEKFDRDQNEIFAVQDEVVRTIVATLANHMQAAIVELGKRKPPTSLAAYECVLRADALPFGVTAAMVEARRLLERAIELDPGYARAYAFLSNSYRLEWSNDMSGSRHLLEKALELGKMAVALDDNDSTCHRDLGWVQLQLCRHDLAEHHFLKALELNPNLPSNMMSLAILHAYRGKARLGLECFEKAKLLDPSFNPTWYWRMLGVVHFAARQYDEAVSSFLRSPQMPDWVHAYLAASFALMNKSEDARYHAAEALRLTPNLSLIQLAAKDPYEHDADRRQLLEGFRQAGLPE